MAAVEQTPAVCLLVCSILFLQRQIFPGLSLATTPTTATPCFSHFEEHACLGHLLDIWVCMIWVGGQDI